jgi:molecular chaperone GrpE
MDEENVAPGGTVPGNDEEKDAEMKAENRRDAGKKKRKNEEPSLEDRLEALEEEKASLYDRLLREKATLENFRKRTEREKRELREYARGEVINEFLAVYDNFERAMTHMDSKDQKNLRDGVELIFKQLNEILARLGVKPVEDVGVPFDPTIHEAISQEKTSEVPDRAVLRVFEKGYLLNGRLLRPAKVVVASNKDSEAGEGDGPASGNGSVH